MSLHRRFHLLGNLIHFHAYSHETNNRYCLVETLTAPGAGAPPNHHASEEENYVVMDGTVEFMIDGVPHVVSTGEQIRVPTGALHAFTNIGDTPARMLIFNAPGRVHDKFFSEAGDPVAEDSWEFPTSGIRDGVDHVLAVASAAGIHIPPPPA